MSFPQDVCKLLIFMLSETHGTDVGQTLTENFARSHDRFGRTAAVEARRLLQGDSTGRSSSLGR
jgi:hypothetical protein